MGDTEDFLRGFALYVGVPAVIAIVVKLLFMLGATLGVEWYVSAVAILLMGRYVFGLWEH